MTQFKDFLKKSFFAGFLVIVPLALSLWILWGGTVWMDQLVLVFLHDTLGLSQTWNPNYYLPFNVQVPGWGILLVIVLLVLVGAVARLFFISYFISLGEQIIGKIPFFNSLYSGIKQLLETLFSGRGDRFSKVVLLEYPRKGIYSIGFITGESSGELQQKTQKKVYNIFLPTSPNPTSGYYLMVPEEDIIELSMSVEQAFKVIISGGIIAPPTQK